MAGRQMGAGVFRIALRRKAVRFNGTVIAGTFARRPLGSRAHGNSSGSRSRRKPENKKSDGEAEFREGKLAAVQSLRHTFMYTHAR
jgi:hypothetical protein